MDFFLINIHIMVQHVPLKQNIISESETNCRKKRLCILLWINIEDLKRKYK